MSIKLGSKVKCHITEYEGVATAKVEYVTGCIQFLVETKLGERWIDESRLLPPKKKRKKLDPNRKKRKYVRKHGGFRSHPESSFGDN